MQTMEKKTLSILGATGSIGQNTLDLVRRNPADFDIVALTAFSGVELLIALAKEFKPVIATIGNEELFTVLKDGLAGTGIRCTAGEEGLLEAANEPSDMVVAAIVGAAGLRPVLTAVRRGATIALANKEYLVCAGDLMMQEVATHGATLLPVDSEHNAIFQVFDDAAENAVSRIILTASGGPFLNRSVESLGTVTPKEAVAHPNWDMGAKISVDSATMMNKGLEVIEAYHLFPVEKHQLDIVIHPQSVIHSMVEYIDGSTLAQLGCPDMRVPIASCLAWPNRMRTPAKKLNLAEIGSLDFFDVDYTKFKCLQLAKDALLAGGAAPTMLNAANEVAVAAFLDKKIGFLDISTLVETVLSKSDMKEPHSLANVFEIDTETRSLAQSYLPKA
ncbi:MAG: 1-deoxy-D-xylulose-5-phosphate reductoisomerase [Kordiimonadaceae bacterium]|nr:1-deoxy-D-xylulose-5-phosphate reductoisomerase [Kordiimonadaceae bacterium]